MRPNELQRLVAACNCRVSGWDIASNDPHRLVIGTLIQGFNHSQSTVLCEPSLSRQTNHKPDVVLVDPIAGLHVLEVKGHDLSQIDGIDPGGQVRFWYEDRIKKLNPVFQARSALLDIKSAVEKAYVGDLKMAYKYWAVFPRITRAQWIGRWGIDGFCPPELLFADDLEGLSERLRSVGRTYLANQGGAQVSQEEFAAIWMAFGDSSVVNHRPEDREPRRAPEGTLGDLFDDAAETYKTLSEEQQRLSEQNWHEGPRLIRGVAGSGKTIVLANNLARRLQRSHRDRSLFDDEIVTERLLVVCNNRSLVPFLDRKIALAFQQRTGRPLPENGLEVRSYNRLMYHLSQQGLWRYQRIGEATDDVRASLYLQNLLDTKKHHPEIFDAVGYDAVYVDEGQDFHEEDFRLLKELCRIAPSQEPNLYVFYDDAQNFLGRKRPNWLSLGLNIRGGRANVMSECFRNTRPIVEAAFNVLYGTMANGNGDIPTREFGDIANLEEKKQIVSKDGFWRIHFAVRDGLAPKLTMVQDPVVETNEIVSRLRWLIEVQKVRPQDILVLSMKQRRVENLADAVKAAKIAGVEQLHIAFNEQDKLLGQRSTLTFSTTASAKGYDAYCVLLASANDFDHDVIGRISFYVGCTRAIEYLEVFAHRREGLVAEWEATLGRQKDFALKSD